MLLNAFSFFLLSFFFCCIFFLHSALKGPLDKTNVKNKDWNSPKLLIQRAKKVLSDSPGLVDFAVGLVNSVFNLPDGQVMFYEEFE